jgi:23S rRNA pseudouridine955/2504/2580 synthase
LHSEHDSPTFIFSLKTQLHSLDRTLLQLFLFSFKKKMLSLRLLRRRKHSKAIVSAGNEGMRVDRWLRERFPSVPLGVLHKLMRKGLVEHIPQCQVPIDGGDGLDSEPLRRRVARNHRLSMGDVVFYPERLSGEYVGYDESESVGPKMLSQLPSLNSSSSDSNRNNKKPSLRLRDSSFIELVKSLVVHEDDWIVALNKRNSMVCAQATRGEQSIESALARLYGSDEVRVVVPLDKSTTGIVIAAKHRKAQQRLDKAMREREIDSEFWALASPAPKLAEGRIRCRLAKRGNDRRHERMVIVDDDDDGGGDVQNARMATTEYTVLDRIGSDAAFLSLRPLSARKHQMRVQLADALNTPIVGDFKYGVGIPLSMAAIWRKESEPALCLHSRAVRLRHPRDQSELTLEAPLPAHFVNALRDLGVTKLPAFERRHPLADMTPAERRRKRHELRKKQSFKERRQRFGAKR